MLRLTTFSLTFFALSFLAQAQDIIITMQGSLFLCEGESIQIGPTEVTGGDGNYTYEWTPGDQLSADDIANPDFAPDSPGDYPYTLTVRDGSGQESSESQTINVDPLPVIDAQVQQQSCGFVGGGFISSTSSIPNSLFLWSTGDTSPTIGNLAAGTYCVTVTSPSGCETEECFIIEELSFPQVTILGLPDTHCEEVTELTIVVTGGVAPYTFNWSVNGITVSTSSTLIAPIDGFYQIIVADSNNCSETVNFELNSGIRSDIGGAPILNCGSGLTELNIGNSSTGDGVIYTWTSPTGETQEATSIIVDLTGTYSLTVNDPAIPDCSATTSVTVTDTANDIEEWITTEIQQCNSYLLSGITIDDYFGEYIYTWTLPDGTNSASISIEAQEAGLYILETQIPGLNCSSTNSIFIDPQGGCGTLSGSLRLDSSDDCVAQDTEIGIANIVVTATNGVSTFNAFTDAEGLYDFFLPIGEYIITHNLPSSNWMACQDSYMANISEGGTSVLNIALQAEGDCPELSVAITAPIMRRCFQNIYYLSVCNLGPATAVLPEVTVVLDDFLNYLNASINPNSIDGQSLTFTLPDLTPGACTELSIHFIVSCESELGQAHCTEVYATPDPLCASGGDAWSGANLEISGDCINDEVVFTIVNTGSGDLMEPVGLIVIEDGIAMMNPGQELPPLPADESEDYTFPANGSTYTFILDQAAGHPYSTSISSSVEGCGFNAQSGFSLGFVTQYSQLTPTPASVVYCLENTGSYDPNDKAAWPQGYGTQQYIEPETELNYRIRFQNTGTDTAFTVAIRDTLSEWLDVSSLRAGNSSHNYRLDISQERILTFTFDNILLPDSTTNEPASNGFVFYKISPKADAPLETIIENQAAIYFDFNEPVLTNTVFHTLGRNFILTNWTTIPGLDLSWKAYPNPVINNLQLELEGDVPTGTKTVRIHDAQGRLLATHPLENTRLTIPTNNWADGWYQLSLLDEQGQLLGQGTIVKAK